jgi:GNAT superfamily N-acetyltransferase
MSIPRHQPLAPGSGPQGNVIAAGPADLDTLSHLIAGAFHPLAPSCWLIADPAARREIFPAYFRLLAEHAMASGVVHTTPGRTAAALWIPAGQHGPGQPAGYRERLAAAAGPWTSRFLAFDLALTARHPVGVPHHHLAILAVRPDSQGQGTGTTLLNAYHQILDHDARAPAYLDAADLRTRQLYLRHGYTDHGPPIRLPDGPLMHPMWRECRPPHPSHAPALPRRVPRSERPAEPGPGET